ncbi:MAG: right-handed parallel beta-helix repeat-containing protein [bacterium]|nr:right-handed parallel beta-helix repeat-containing protein [bacterium]
MKLIKFLITLSFLVTIGVGYSFAGIHLVPTEYATIQEAIGAAINGDTLLVSPGTYHENLDFLGKDLELFSLYRTTGDSNFIVSTIIDGGDVGSCLRMVSGETGIVSGFTLMNGIGSPYLGIFRVGGAFYLMNSSPTIDHNIIKENVTPDGGGGIFSDGGSPIIQYNNIVNNVTTSGSGCGAGILIMNTAGGEIAWNYLQFNTAKHGGGIAINGASPLVTRNVIAFNTAISTGGGGIAMYNNSSPDVINNTISNNTAPCNWGGGVEIQDGSAPVFMNNIVSFSVQGGGFAVIGSCTAVFSYNLYFENVGGNYINCVPGLGDLVGDPAYIGGAPYDFHLTALSAAIDHGNPDIAYRDPDGTRNDCGAFYYNQGATTPVVLQSFNAALVSEGVQLNWSTACELECYGWYLQRQTENGEFVNISPFISGYGTSIEEHDYGFTDVNAQIGNSYTYRLLQIDIGGAVTYSDEISVTCSLSKPERFSLLQNYPNPFNPETVISYTLPDAMQVRLTIFDISGRLISELSNGMQDVGLHKITWSGRRLTAGTYICRLEAGAQTYSRLLTLVK